MDDKPKIMVAGGATIDKDRNTKVLDTVEILDFISGSWVEGGRLPWPMTGVSLVEAGNRPILIGRDQPRRVIMIE